MIAYIVNHSETPNIIVTLIDTFSVVTSCMSIICNLRYLFSVPTTTATIYQENIGC